MHENSERRRYVWGGRGRCKGSVECGWVGTWGWVGVWSGECACGESGGVHMGIDGCTYVCVLVSAVCVVYICAHACT